MKTKTCSKCKTIKNISEFYPNINNGSIDGLHSWCRNCINLNSKKRYAFKMKQNPEKFKAFLRDTANKWRRKNLKRAREMSKKFHEKRRLKILTYYSKGTPKCNCCGEKHMHFLSIDHINGGGLKNARKYGYGRAGLNGWIIKNNFPKGFQILCHNCNFSKGHYGKCPHTNKGA